VRGKLAEFVIGDLLATWAGKLGKPLPLSDGSDSADGADEDGRDVTIGWHPGRWCAGAGKGRLRWSSWAPVEIVVFLVGLAIVAGIGWLLRLPWRPISRD
jgi:hypothetical protein